MKPIIIFFAAFVSAPVMAQTTTLDITVPGTGNPVCSYITGPVTNGTTSGHLQATATSSSGAGCGTGSSGDVTFGPALPLSPQTTTVQSGNAVSYSFEALNATTCTAAITGAASGSFTGGSTLCSGTGASTCNNRLVTASASFTNTGSSNVADTVTLTCTGAAGQAQSIANVTVQPVGLPPPPGSCSRVIPGDGTSGVHSFTSQGTTSIKVGGDQHTITADMSQFASVFGSFPGRNGDIAYDNLPIGNYISLQFSLPSGFVENAPTLPIPYYQWLFMMGETGMDTKVSMSISTSCGDFSPTTISGSTVVNNCRKVGLKADGGVQFFAEGDPNSQCVLQDNVTYYLNLINANVTNVTPTGGSAASYRDGPGTHCGGKSTCSVPMINGPRVTYPQYP
ncbi:MAG TPA: hypothetical protein VH107_19810 [Lacipirellulaceae bacterium]|nr:hypothetical protein [Lacipirellulaceae bacterium]